MKDAEPPSLLSIPSELLALVVSQVARADVRNVAWFGAASRGTHTAVRDARTIELCESEMRLPSAAGSRATTVAALALHQAVLENIVSSWVVFKPGGDEFKPGERPLLARAATLLRRFEGAQLEIEGHAAAAAPADTGEVLSRSRAMAILKELLEHGTPRERLRARAWGRRLSVGWPEDDPATARAEIYFWLHGARFPARPAKYAELGPDVPPISPREWPRVEERPGGAAARARLPPDTSRRALLQMVRQARAEKGGSPRATAAASDGPAGVQDQAAREKRECLARAAEQRLGVVAVGQRPSAARGV